MTFPVGVPATGRLMSWHGRGGTFKGWADLPGAVVVPLATPGWKSLSVLTLGAPSAPPPPADGRYEFLVRESGEHTLLLAPSADYILPFVSNLGSAWMPRAPAIQVPQLVRDLIEARGQYAMSGIYAKVFGFGRSLRTIIMYGADLADAAMVHQMMERLYPYRVSLRRVATEKEVLVVGSRGECGLNYRGVESLTDAEEALRFISERHYIDWRRRFSLDRISPRWGDVSFEEMGQ